MLQAGGGVIKWVCVERRRGYNDVIVVSECFYATKKRRADGEDDDDNDILLYNSRLRNED